MKRILVAAFAALWLLDTTATLAFVGLHGPEAEANPLIRWVLVEHGAVAFGLVKAGTLGLWLTVAHRAHVSIHWVLLAVMVPVVVFGHAMGVA